MGQITKEVIDRLQLSETLYDTVFDIMMLRLEALAPHKTLVRDIARDKCLWPMLVRSVPLEFSRFAKGPSRYILSFLYAPVFFYWLSHTEEETMVFLDSLLRYLTSSFS